MSKLCESYELSNLKTNIKNALCEIDDNLDRIEEWVKGNETHEIVITIRCNPEDIPSVEYGIEDRIRSHEGE